MLIYRIVLQIVLWGSAAMLAIVNIFVGSTFDLAGLAAVVSALALVSSIESVIHWKSLTNCRDLARLKREIVAELLDELDERRKADIGAAHLHSLDGNGRGPRRPTTT